MQPSNHEALREALLNVERVRDKERAAREQMETLIQGLQILNESHSVAEMYQEILASLQRVIPFDCAAILVQSDNGFLSTAVSSDSRLKLSGFPASGPFQRCLNGIATIVTHLSKVPEWPQTQSHRETPLHSAIMVDLHGLEHPTIIVCASEQSTALKRSDLKMLQTFKPLATQAVQRASELEKLNILVNKLDFYAHYDMMTGLANRSLFDIRLEQELSASERFFCVLFLDLDNFKQINDTYGHNAGDILLGEIAFRLSGAAEPQDTVARMGGDEFALIMRNVIDVSSIFQRCEKLIHKVREPVFLRKNRIEPTVSIGIAICSEPDQTAQCLMQNADIALYEAKKSGRDCFQLFNLQMKTQLDRQTAIEKGLKRALLENEFWLSYQMIIDTRRQTCHCLEVLLRWGTDYTSLYSPAEFIPIAESIGEICHIGIWVIKTALAELEQWLLSDSRNIAAINVSDVQLHQQTFAEEVISVVRASGIPACQIELELSERIVTANINDAVKNNLIALRTFGFLFSYDDFGSGQASFLHLQHLPGSRLKIDKEFIDSIEESTAGKQLVAGIIGFAHTMKLEVIAEGVETSAQAEWLKSVRCDYLQGYLFSRPSALSECMNSILQLNGLSKNHSAKSA